MDYHIVGLLLTAQKILCLFVIDNRVLQYDATMSIVDDRTDCNVILGDAPGLWDQRRLSFTGKAIVLQEATYRHPNSDISGRPLLFVSGEIHHHSCCLVYVSEI